MTQLIYSALPQPRRPLLSVHPEMNVAECIDIMVKENVGALVVQEGAKLIGILSERDLVRGSLKKNFDLHKTKVSELVYKDVSILNLYDPLDKAMETITKTKRRHILVTEHDKLIAILSIGDLLFYLLEDKTKVIEHLENYIHS